MKHLYFMRHGLSLMNKQGIFSGRTDTPLTEEGVHQCHEAAKTLKGVKIDVIVASPMKRTIDSAKIIAEEIGFPPDKIVVNDLFMERDFGPVEGSEYSPKANLNQTGVEPIDSLIERTNLGLKFIQELDGDSVLLVSHGAIGRALRHALNPTLGYHKGEGFNNAEIVKLI